mgnify:CR=1 FL=1
MWVLLSTPTPDPYEFLMAHHILEMNPLAGKPIDRHADAQDVPLAHLHFPSIRLCLQCLTFGEKQDPENRPAQHEEHETH